MLFQSRADSTTQLHVSDSDPIFVPEREPFINFDSNTELTFEDKSRLYNSLVSLVKEEYPFDDVLKDRTVQFLKSLELEWGQQDLAAKLVSDLVPSPTGSPSGFMESIVTLLSSPYSTVVAAMSTFLSSLFLHSSPAIRLSFVNSDLIMNLLSTLQPHSLSLVGNETIVGTLNVIIAFLVQLAYPFYIRDLNITTAIEQYTHREIIFQKIVIPSSPFVTFLISNRYILNQELSGSFIEVLCILLRIGPFHHPTLDYVLTSPIVMAFSSHLSFVEYRISLWTTLNNIRYWRKEWKDQGPEIARSGKRIVHALFSEGFEDTLETMLASVEGHLYRIDLIGISRSIQNLLGSNVTST